MGTGIMVRSGSMEILQSTCIAIISDMKWATSFVTAHGSLVMAYQYLVSQYNAVLYMEPIDFRLTITWNIAHLACQ